jgi:hypothetical protein
MRAARLAIAVAALGLCACAFVPKDYPRLDEARLAHARARGDPLVARLAPEELSKAEELLNRAIAARDTLDDPAVVDHLAYLARQRAIIAMELARKRAREALDPGS